MKATILAAALLAALAMPALAADKIAVVHTSDALGFSPDWIALDEGIFARHGLDPEISIVAGDAATLPAVHSGNAQFGAMTLVAALQAEARGEPLRVVTPLVREFVVQILINPKAAARAGITPDMDFKEKMTRARGLTIGTLDVGGGLQLVFNGFAKQYGFSPDKDYNLTAIKSYPGLLDAAKRGDIDMCLLAIPYGDIGASTLGLQWFANFWTGDVKQVDGTVFQGVVAEADYVAKNPDLVERFHQALDDTFQFMRASPNKAIADMHKRFPNYSTDLLHTYYVDDINSYVKRAVLERHGFSLLQDFVSKNMIAAAADVKYETFVLPSAQEK